MKLIRCNECGEPIALTHRWLNCECGRSGGSYEPDGSRCVVAGPCSLYGIDNRVFFGLRVEAWPYDESAMTKRGEPKVRRIADNPSRYPERMSA